MKYNTFKFFTNTLKAVKEDNTRYIVGDASSTSIDRDGDRMSESAIHTMKSTAEANLTIFTNHEYKVPDNLFGSCVEATVKAQKDASPIVVKSADGETEIATFQPQSMQVKIKVVSDEVNPDAGRLYKALEEGISLGFSIAGVVTKAVAVLDDVTQKTYNLIEAINLYEISVVAIPANQDAMNLAISKSLNRGENEEIDKEQVQEIVEKAKIKELENAGYTMEGVHKYVLGELKKYYDDYYSPQTAEQKEEVESCDKQRAKAQAENVLMQNSVSTKVDKTDDDEIHLISHSYALQYSNYEDDVNNLFIAHIQTHLKRLQKDIATEE